MAPLVVFLLRPSIVVLVERQPTIPPIGERTTSRFSLVVVRWQVDFRQILESLVLHSVQGTLRAVDDEETAT